MDFGDRYILTRLSPIGLAFFVLVGILLYFRCFIFAPFVLLAGLSIAGDITLLVKRGVLDRRRWLNSLDWQAIDRLPEKAIQLWSVLSKGQGHYWSGSGKIY